MVLSNLQQICAFMFHTFQHNAILYGFYTWYNHLKVVWFWRNKCNSDYDQTWFDGCNKDGCSLLMVCPFVKGLLVNVGIKDGFKGIAAFLFLDTVAKALLQESVAILLLLVAV
ncbi:hypothetical protein L6452_07366 [Arctium lappa]|uniref:Uncharacterized protein n=1 Tax=Arctium lappa TaxID=4217 RepID=A0ACB9ELB3_ARCLA|nr:hypothetical protein L6452_07366 [Arctium lappa]